MAEQSTNQIKHLVHEQLSLLIENLSAVTGTWPITIEFSILSLVSCYLSDEAGSEIVAQILESEAAVLRCPDQKVPAAMKKHHHDLIDQLLRAHMLNATPVKGSA